MAIASSGDAMATPADQNRIDTPEIGPESTPDEVLDAGIEYTFPASDPVSVESAYRMAAQKRAA